MKSTYLKIILLAIAIAVLVVVILKLLGYENTTVMSGGITGGIVGALAGVFGKKK